MAAACALDVLAGGGELDDPRLWSTQGAAEPTVRQQHRCKAIFVVAHNENPASRCARIVREAGRHVSPETATEHVKVVVETMRVELTPLPTGRGRSVRPI